MKKILCIILSMLLVTTPLVYATEIVSKPLSLQNVNTDFYDVYKLHFEEDTRSSLNYTIDMGFNKKYDECIELVKSLNLNDRLEDVFIQNLLKDKESGERLLSYEVYIPKNTKAADEHFDWYNGYEFRAAYSITDTMGLEKKLSTGKNFVNGVVDIIIGSLNWKIAVPYSIFKLAQTLDDQNSLDTYGISTQKAYLKTEKTVRVLSIEDKLNLHTIDFVPILQDEAAIYGHEEITCNPNPYFPSFVSLDPNVKYDHTVDWENATSAMSRSLHRYQSGQTEMLIDRLNSADLYYGK